MSETGQEIPQADKPKKERATRKPRTPKTKIKEVIKSDLQHEEVEDLQTKIPVKRRRSKTFPVIVKGAVRHITRLAYEAAKKDPNLKVQLPEGSPFLEEGQSKGCKDC
jgi:hypothetical protein